MTKLAGSGADVFLDIGAPKAGAQAIGAVAASGWKPLHILNAVAACKTQVLKPVGFNYAQGIVTAAYTKAAADPQWTDDAATKGVHRRPQDVRAGRRPAGPVQRLRLVMSRFIAARSSASRVGAGIFFGDSTRV